MDNTIIMTPLQIVGVLGIGSGIWVIIEKITQYKLDKKKFLFKEKLEAFDLLAKNIVGFSLHKKLPITVFDNFANSARARLMINDRKLDRKIHQFFITLDLLINNETKEDREDNELDKKWKQLQEEALEIIDSLKNDLNNTI